MDQEFIDKLYKLYNIYNETIKPLIALIESRYEKFPQPLFNEIRAFNDHIAQCYRDNVDEKYIVKELEKASRHIKRILLDCFKFLNVSYNDYVKNFERQTKNIDLTLINNGTFYIEYSKLIKSATNAVRAAKTIESRNNDEGLEQFQEAFNFYVELEDLIEGNKSEVIWARAKFVGKRLFRTIAWVAAAILSGVFSSLIAGYWENIKNFFQNIF